MACVALKRSHFDLQASPNQEPCGEPSAKRRCSLAAMSPCHSTPPRPYAGASCSPIFHQSPVSRVRILADVNGEIKLLRRRRRHLARMSEEAPEPSTVSTQTSRRDRLHCSTNAENDSSSTVTAQRASDSPVAKPDKPVFTAKQVADFCQRKLKEREEELKVLFDQILTERLTDQYDSFVRFTEDSLRRRFADRDCSYVS